MYILYTHTYTHTHRHANSVAQSWPTLCDFMDCSPPGSSLHGIFPGRILEQGIMPFSEDLPDPGIEPESLVAPALAGGFFTTEPPGNPTHIYIHTHKHTYIYKYIYTKRYK